MSYFVNNLNQKIAYKFFKGKSPGIIFIHGLNSDMEGLLEWITHKIIVNAFNQ